MALSTRFTIKQDDRREPIRRVLKDSAGAVVDLTNAQGVKFIMTRVADVEPRIKSVRYLASLLTDQLQPKVDAAATVVGAAQGDVQYNWLAADVDTTGVFLGEFEVTHQDGTKQSFPNGSYIVVVIRRDLA